jgi:colanic acid/amylovoran biosynthesis glycosyltransferase
MRLAAFFREQGVTVALAEFGHMGVLAADVCAALDIPLHVYFYGIDASANLRFPAVRRRYRALWPKVASVICISRFLAERLIATTGLPEHLVEVIPCGVDPARFRPAASEPGRVLALGRLVEKKAPHLTVRAFARAAADHPGARLDLIGEGPLRPQVEAAIAETGMGDRITLHGALGREACAEPDAPRRDLRAAFGDGRERRHRGLADRHRRGDGERAAGGLDPAQRHPRGG